MPSMAYREYRSVRGLIHLGLVDAKAFDTPSAECPGLGVSRKLRICEARRVTNYNQPPAQQVYVQLAPRQPSNGLAIAGLVTGIVGAALSLIPFVGVFLCWLPALLAIVFGFIAIGTAKRTGLRRNESLAAIILGFVPIPVTVLYILIGVGVAASSSSYSS